MAIFLIVVAVLCLLSSFAIAWLGQEGKVRTGWALCLVPALFTLSIVVGSIASYQIAPTIIPVHV